MKVQLKDITTTHPQTGAFIVNFSLVKLAQTEPGQGVTKQQAYWLSRIAEAAGKEIDRLEKRRVDLVKQYGKDDGKGNFSVEPEQAEKFASEVNEWLDVEVEIPGDPIRLADLGDEIKLSGIDYIRLRWLIQGEEEPAEKAQAASGD